MRPESEKEDSGSVWMMPEGVKSGPGRGAGRLERSNGVIIIFFNSLLNVLQYRFCVLLWFLALRHVGF